MQAWQRWTLIAAAVAALHGALLWAAGRYRVPAALQRPADALQTRTVEPPKLLQAQPPEPLPIPKATPPIATPAAKTPPKPAATPATAAVPLQPTAAAAPPLAVLTAPSATAPTAAPAAPPAAPTPASTDAAPAVAKAAPNALAAVQPVAAPAAPNVLALQPSTDADHADTQYRIALPTISTRLGEAGRVIVRVQVGVDGKALQVQLKTSSGFARLDENALATVARWRFKPGTRGGVPEVMWMEQPVNYAAQ